MNLKIEPGKYVVAVSGGVDSVTLLHLLHHKNLISRVPSWKLAVVHFDHGIRPDSGEDAKFVKDLAKQYGLPYFSESANLGAEASEDTAREARYNFLRRVKEEQKARAIITAHHQDDLIETVAINLLRGTGRKGLSPMLSNKDVARPLINFSKQQILKYARDNGLVWREDSTNTDEKYLRNYLRHSKLNSLSDKDRANILKLAQETGGRNKLIDEILDGIVSQGDKSLARTAFNSLPHDVSKELISHWLRVNGVSFDKKTIQRIVVALKTLKSGAKIDVSAGWYFLIEKNAISLYNNLLHG